MWNASIAIFEPRLDALRAALASAESCSDLSHGVVVDNGASAEAKSLVTQFPKFRYELNPDGNAGFGSAHNFAFRSLPASPFHAVLNPDIRFEPEAIRRLIETMSADRTIGLAGPALFNPDGSQQLLCKRYPSIRALLARRFLPTSLSQWIGFDVDADYFEMRDSDYAREIEPEFMSGALMMFRRETFERLQGFDERFFLYFEDCDITLRARSLGRAVYVPNARVTHDWARGSHRSVKLTWVTIVSLVKLFNKHGWRWRDPNLSLRHF